MPAGKCGTRALISASSGAACDLGAPDLLRGLSETLYFRHDSVIATWSQVVPGHLVMEWLRQGPQQQSYQCIKSIFNPSAPSLEAHLASCAAPLDSVPKPAQPVTSGNHVPTPWTIKGQDQRPLLLLSTDKAKLVISRPLFISVALCPSPLLSRLEAPGCPGSRMLAFG